MRAITLQHHGARIVRVEQQLARDLDQPFDLSGLARSAGLSPRQFERVFTRTVGETPQAFARRLRLERSADQLRTTGATVLAIALEAGFESHAAFTRAFRHRFGYTPASFRKLSHTTLQPRVRAQLWQLAGAALRRHIER